MNFKIISK